MENSPQFVCKLLVAVCSTLVVNKTTAAVYDLRTNSQAQRFNSTIVSRPRHYASKQQTDWDIYLLPPTNAHNAQMRRYIKVLQLAWLSREYLSDLYQSYPNNSLWI